jgi:hypothetical protein
VKLGFDQVSLEYARDLVSEGGAFRIFQSAWGRQPFSEHGWGEGSG